jgi:hypothetical protein
MSKGRASSSKMADFRGTSPNAANGRQALAGQRQHLAALCRFARQGPTGISASARLARKLLIGSHGRVGADFRGLP